MKTVTVDQLKEPYIEWYLDSITPEIRDYTNLGHQTVHVLDIIRQRAKINASAFNDIVNSFTDMCETITEDLKDQGINPDQEFEWNPKTFTLKYEPYNYNIEEWLNQYLCEHAIGPLAALDIDSDDLAATLVDSGIMDEENAYDFVNDFS